MTQPEHVLIRSDLLSPGVLQLTLDRPAQRNALSAGLLVELAGLLEAASRDPEIRCVVLAGNERFFSAGADIKEMARDGFAAIDSPARQAAWRSVETFPKPLVAAVEGICFGGGAELMMLADIVVAGEGARFGQPEINIGILPGDGATQRLTRVVGKALAMRMILTGEPIEASLAVQAGLVSEVVRTGQALAKAREIAATIATKSPAAARLAKEAVLAAYDTSLSAGLLVERRAIRHAFTTSDQREGMAAFVEKRPPAFTGS